jgi:hypothetical protein
MQNNKTKKIIKNIAMSLFTALFIFSCSTLTKVMNTMSDLNKIQFKLGNVNNFTISNVNISNIKQASDISITDGLKLTQAVSSRTLPTTFTLNVVASNPNKKSSDNNKYSTLDAVISSIDWILLIDDKETINGRVSTPVTIPAGTQTTNIPVSIGLDLFKFFGDKGYNDIINLALAVGGVNGSAARLKLKMKPVVSIAGYPISYPNYITAIDKEFR